MQSTLVKTFFPNFEEVFGRTDKLILILESTSAPEVTVKEEESKIKTKALIRFKNPLND